MEGTRQSKVIVEIKNHMWARHATTDDPIDKWVPIETGTGMKEDYILFNYLEGWITAIEYAKTSKRGMDILKIKMSNGDQERVVRIPFFKRAAIQFMQRMENIKYGEVVRIHIGYDDKSADTFNEEFLWVTQGDYKPQIKYTKDNPEGKPPWEKIGNDWSREKEYDFYKSKIRELVGRERSLTGGLSM